MLNYMPKVSPIAKLYANVSVTEEMARYKNSNKVSKIGSPLSKLYYTISVENIISNGS